MELKGQTMHFGVRGDERWTYPTEGFAHFLANRSNRDGGAGESGMQVAIPRIETGMVKAGERGGGV